MAIFDVSRQPAVKLAKGTEAEVAKTPLTDGLLSVTTDDGRIHIDYSDENGEIVRKTLYSGKLTIGQHVYDGTEHVAVDEYNGEIV